MLRLFKILTVVFILIISLSNFVSAADNSTGFQLIDNDSGLSLHKEMFMLPYTYSDEYNGENAEAVFQLSSKHRLFGSQFYFAYTQISFWQSYDFNHSAPFRETNYNPEIFYRLRTSEFQSGMIGADLGFEHESNGQRPPISRSWNLLYITPYYYTDKFMVHLKIRYRIPEDEKEFPESFVGDDNPDITDYLGHTDLNFFYKVRPNRIFHLTLRGNLEEGRGIIAVSYRTPVPKSENSFFFLKVSHGYGESMVDYNKKLTRIGLGIMFGK